MTPNNHRADDTPLPNADTMTTAQSSQNLAVPELRPCFATLVIGPSQARLPKDSTALSNIEEKLEKLIGSLNEMFRLRSQSSQIPYKASERKNSSVMRVVTGLCTGTGTIARNAGKKLNLPTWVLCENREFEALADTEDKNNFLIFDDNLIQYRSAQRISAKNELAISASDLILLIWDGEASSLKNQDADEILRHAILAGRPIIWMNYEANSFILQKEAWQENVKVALSTDALTPLQIRSFFAPATDSSLDQVIDLIVDPVAAQQKYLSNYHSVKFLKNYFFETSYSQFFSKFAGRLDKLITAAFTGASVRVALTSDATHSWYGVEPRDLKGFGAFIKEPQSLKERFNWSDRIANIAAGFHRDLTWVLYLFAALAVFSAIAGSIKLWPGGNSIFWSLFELLLISAIAALVLISRRAKWHSKWLSHRFLAEQLRYARAGLPFAVFQKPLVLSPYKVERDSRGELKIHLRSAEQWILQRQLIEVALPEANSPGAFHFSRHAVEATLYLQKILDGQIKYHQASHRKYHKLAHKLHTLTSIFFAITFAAVISHLFWHPEWLLLFTGALPAFAAAIHGIITQNELRKLDLLSSAMARELKNISEAIDEALKERDSTQWLRLRGLAAKAIGAMSNVSEEWHDLIREREATLPA